MDITKESLLQKYRLRQSDNVSDPPYGSVKNDLIFVWSIKCFEYCLRIL